MGDLDFISCFVDIMSIVYGLEVIPLCSIGWEGLQRLGPCGVVLFDIIP